MKTTILFPIVMLMATSGLSGCNTIQTNEVAIACEQGIKRLSGYLNTPSAQIHQANLSRASSLLIAAEVQHQFAEYPGCIEKVQRAQHYLTGKQAAIISRLTI